MLFDSWYTDVVEVYRVSPTTSGSLDTQTREKVGKYCGRIYQPQKNSISVKDTAAESNSNDKLAVPLSADIREGDELRIVRGGAIGYDNEPERYFAGRPMPYYDPVGGALTGLEHKEIGLMQREVVR